MYDLRKNFVYEDGSRHAGTRAGNQYNADASDVSSISKRHKCEKCGSFFAQRSGLEIHMNVHTGDKPFLCGAEECESRFGDPSSKTRHHREVHQIQGAYHCIADGCRSKIKRRSAFKDHMKKKHGLILGPQELDALAPPLRSLTRSKQQTSKQEDHGSTPEPSGNATPFDDQPSVQNVGSSTHSLVKEKQTSTRPVDLSTLSSEELFRDSHSLITPVNSSTLPPDDFFMNDKFWTHLPLNADNIYTVKAAQNLNPVVAPPPSDADYLKVFEPFFGEHSAASSSLSPAATPSDAVGQRLPGHNPLGQTVYTEHSQNSASLKSRLEENFDPELFGLPNRLSLPLLSNDGLFASNGSSPSSLSHSATPSPHPPQPNYLDPFFGGQLAPLPPAPTMRQRSPGLFPYGTTVYTGHEQNNTTTKRKLGQEYDSDFFQAPRTVRSRTGYTGYNTNA